MRFERPAAGAHASPRPAWRPHVGRSSRRSARPGIGPDGPPEKRVALECLISAGKSAARKLTNARILLLADATDGNERADEEIVDALGTSPRTIARIRQRFVSEGLQAAIDRSPSRPGPTRSRSRGTSSNLHGLPPLPPPDAMSQHGDGPARGRRAWRLVHRDRGTDTSGSRANPAQATRGGHAPQLLNPCEGWPAERPHRAASPSALAGRPPTAPRDTSDPSGLIRNPTTWLPVDPTVST